MTDTLLIKKYVTGEAVTPEEKARLLDWVKADEKNKNELAAFYKLYTLTTWNEAPAGNTAPSPTLSCGNHPKNAAGNRLYKTASVAAIALLALCCVYIFHLRQETAETVMQTIHVPPGQRVEVILADGTGVWLNAGSTFTFPNLFSDKSRDVALNGEAYFHVKKDPKRPFVVQTPSHSVKALGTDFNVLDYRQSPLFEVSLFNGIVDVYSGDGKKKIRLEPDTRLYRKNHLLTKEQILSYNPYLWKDGLICFDDEPVGLMINKLELYYDVKIIVQNDSFRQQKYTGKFRTKDGIEHILKVFQLRDKFAYEKDDEKNIILIK
jgi:ferric-dicitrate binding protein FerR (iron transport regulator)